jgi:HEAT repeat protein
MNDESWDVRQEVAKRIDPKYLPMMMNDEDNWVRLEVVKRIGSEGGAFAIEHLPKMMNDENYYIRYEVAKRIDPKFLGEMFGLNFDPEYQKGLIRVLAEREDLKK